MHSEESLRIFCTSINSKRKVIPCYSQKGRERIFYLVKMKLTLHLVSSLKTFSLLFPVVSGEQHRVYRERGNN